MNKSIMFKWDAYTLWIIPHGEACSLADGYIGKLSEAYGFPWIEPYVILLGRIPSRGHGTKEAIRFLMEVKNS
jgi:hypothetical protein